MSRDASPDVGRLAVAAAVSGAVALGTIVAENGARIDRGWARPPDRDWFRHKETSMPDQSPPVRFEHSNSYNIFILVLTVMSLIVMALLILPLPDAVHQVLAVYDNLFCVVFLADFALNWTRAERKRDYFIGQRGLARPAGLDPEPGPRHRQRRQRGCAVPARPAESSRPDHPAAARPGRQGPGAGRPQEPRPVRGLHHGPGGVHRARHVERARARVRGQRAGRQHHDRRRRTVVGGGDDHDGRIRRQVSESPCSVA